MKGIILLLFVFTIPVVIFLITILYGGISADILKTELAKADVYKKTSDLVINSTSSDEDPETAQFTNIVKNRLTSSYVQKKTESAIDDSSAWIVGTNTASPSVSFKEIKEDVLSQNPQLLTSLQQTADDMKTQQAQSGYAKTDSSSEDTTADMTKNFNSLNTLITSDFSFHLAPYLQGLKTFYVVIRILMPVLAGFLLFYLIILYMKTSSVSSRLNWIGAALLMSGIWGFTVIAMNTVLIMLLSQFALENTNSFFQLITPIVVVIITHFIDTFTHLQGITSVILFIAAALCFVVSSVYKSKPVSSSKPITSKKK